VLIFRNAVFLHLPKSGGTWVREAARRAGVTFDDYLIDGDQHGDLVNCPCPEKFTFTFVRHPLTWYPSYWRFKMGAGWDERNPFDIDCAAATFHAFVRNALCKYPGWCSQMFEDYAGPPGREVDFVGRFERLADDLVRALRTAGEEFDEGALRETPPANVSSWPVSEILWPQNLLEAVLVAEEAGLRRFGYAMALPGLPYSGADCRPARGHGLRQGSASV
jgi:hypothetical protein